MIAGSYNIDADRWVPFLMTLTFFDQDFTGASFYLQVRAKPDASGSPLIDLTTVTSDVEGVKLAYVGTASIAQHVANGRLRSVPTGYAESDIVLMTQLAVRIDEATMEGLSFPDEVGDPMPLYWDIIVDGTTRRKWLAGKFNVIAGVTQ